MSNSDLDFDDDDDLEGLGESTVDLGESEPEADDEDTSAAAPAKPAVASDGKVPFFRNWVFYTSLIAAIPGVFLAIMIVQSASSHGGQFNWLMATCAFLTFIVAAFLAVLPILIALGFFIGGKEIPAAAEPAQPESMSDSFDDDMDDAGGDFEDDDEFGESDDMFDGDDDFDDDEDGFEFD